MTDRGATDRGARLDPGIREALRLLRAVPGVTSTHSCEGTTRAGDGHASLGYVRIAGRWPHNLRDHLARVLATEGRLDDNAIYARHTRHNRVFRERLETAVAAYLTQRAAGTWIRRRVPLVRLKGRLSAALEAGHGRSLAFCAYCGQPLPAADARRHGTPPCLVFALPPPWNAGPPDLFARFLAERPGAVPEDLTLLETPSRLRARVERGDFGPGCAAAWRAHVEAYLDDLVRNGLWDGVEAARRQGRGAPRSLEYAVAGPSALFAWQT